MDCTRGPRGGEPPTVSSPALRLCGGAATVCLGGTGGIGEPRSAQPASLRGREFQFAFGDSGRSGDPGGPRRLDRRLHIHQRSLSMRDQRRADIGIQGCPQPLSATAPARTLDDDSPGLQASSQ